ncbi:fungal specific transcription factor domain protein [Paecilomyces variotii No. 5]|uniref:Fungal specific transcription factor domain protein n=1 Tax=Byssochlamys spectabilis (strain No. 5 / NBRC 109023) TaxID=1356009 RepID=V5FBF0_BYSSN|nr:fungal specific transcription factor domain protein [Paecilomyces variotii No. 5]
MAEQFTDTTVVMPNNESATRGHLGRRAAKACASCRSRKVRCDALLRRPGPCTNCDLNQVPCAFLPRRTRGRPSIQQEQMRRSSVQVAQSDTQGDHSDIGTISTPSGDLAWGAASNRGTVSTESDQRPGSPKSLDPMGEGMDSNIPSLTDYIDLDTSEMETLLFANSEDLLGPFLSCPSDQHLGGQQSTTDIIESPSFEKHAEIDGYRANFTPPFPWLRPWAPPSHVSGDSWRLIVDKGTLNLPSVATIRKLIRLHFTYFHPSFPVLDEHVFQRIFHSLSSEEQPFAVTADGSLPRIELSLLKAIMFVSSAALDDMIEDDLFNTGNQGHLSLTKTRQWRRIYGCWYLRATGLVLGLKNTSRPEMLDAPAPSLSLSDMIEDIQCATFLRPETKQGLAEFFIARVALATDTTGLCKVLLAQLHKNVTSDRIASRLGKSSLGEIEDSEISLQEWRARHEHLFERTPTAEIPLSVHVGYANEPVSDKEEADRPAFYVARSMLTLLYEYTVSTLHQTSLSTCYKSPSTWAFLVREPSTKALWKSVKATVKELRFLHSQGLLRMMPVTIIVFIFIPLTLYCISVKFGVHFDTEIVSDLAICGSCLRSLEEKYQVGEFFQQLLDASLAIVHENIANFRNEHSERGTQNMIDNPVNSLPGLDIPYHLLPTEIHAAVIRFQDASLATGSIDTVRSRDLAIAGG